MENKEIDIKNSNEILLKSTVDNGNSYNIAKRMVMTGKKIKLH